jgi:branched-chain amino acid aminotransferase
MRDPQDVMRSQILDLCKKNDHQSGYIRITVSRGTTLGLDPKKITGAGHVYISTEQLALYPAAYYENGLDMITVSTRAMVASVIEPRIKSTGKYVSNVQAKLEANRAGVGEGVVLNLQGYVTECTGDNLFVVTNGVVKTPPEYQCGLAGITRATVIALAKENDISLVEVPLTQFDIYTADECFLTGTGAEVVPAVILDGRTIGTGKPGPVTGKLIELFRRHTQVSGVAF